MEDEIDVIGIAPEEECEHEMFILMRWEKDVLAIPLMQIEVIHGDEKPEKLSKTGIIGAIEGVS